MRFQELPGAEPAVAVWPASPAPEPFLLRPDPHPILISAEAHERLTKLVVEVAPVANVRTMVELLSHASAQTVGNIFKSTIETPM